MCIEYCAFRSKQSLLAKGGEEVAIDLGAAAIEDAAPREEDEVDAIYDAGTVKAKRLSQKPLGAVALDGVVEGSLAGDNAETPRGVRLAADPEHQRPAGDVFPGVERLLEVRFADKPDLPAETPSRRQRGRRIGPAFRQAAVPP